MPLTAGAALIFIFPTVVSRLSSTFLFPGSVFQASMTSMALVFSVSHLCWHSFNHTNPVSQSTWSGIIFIFFFFLIPDRLGWVCWLQLTPGHWLVIVHLRILVEVQACLSRICHIHLTLSTHIPVTNLLISTAKLPPLSVHLRSTL